MAQKKQKGFTLIEVIIATSVLGVLTLVIAPAFSNVLRAQEQAYKERQILVNQKLAKAMLDYAETQTKPALPSPCTGLSATRVRYGPANTLTGYTSCRSASASDKPLPLSYALKEGIAPKEVNGDGTASDNIRVYQVYTNIDKPNVPLFGRSGSAVDLRYDYGVVYLTKCQRSQACNNAGPYGPVLSDYVSWQPGTTALYTAYVSTLTIQKERLAETARRLNQVRDGFTAYFNMKRAANPDSSVNHYPSAAGTTSPTDTLSQGCMTDWHPLYEASATSVLDVLGLNKEELGQTSWGGSIEYCNDYDPSISPAANTMPHYAALRIRKAVTEGGAPDIWAPENNVVISF